MLPQRVFGNDNYRSLQMRFQKHRNPTYKGPRHFGKLGCGFHIRRRRRIIEQLRNPLME